MPVDLSIERMTTLPAWAVPLGVHSPATVSAPFVKQVRSSLGVSQAKMALILGVEHRTVQYWESGERVPQLEWLMELEHLALLKLTNGRFPFEKFRLARHLQVMTPADRAAVIAALVNEFQAILEADRAHESTSAPRPATG